MSDTHTASTAATYEPLVKHAPNEPAVVAPAKETRWPLWQRVLFRFAFVYLALQIAPWDWLRLIPGVSFVLKPYDAAVDWATRWGNAHLFHVRDQLVPVDGSGDASFAWAPLWLFLSVAAVAAGAFANVLMINLAYDVPVKLYAAHLFACSVLLLALDGRRLARFLVLNLPTPPTAAYDRPFAHGWRRWVAVAAKAFMIAQLL